MLFIILIAIVLCTPAAWAADFTYQGQHVVRAPMSTWDYTAYRVEVTGPIQTGDAAKLAAIYEQIQTNERPDPLNGMVQLSLNSPGGSFAEALEIIEFQRKVGIATWIGPGAECHSACALIFMAGGVIGGDNDLGKMLWMHRTASLGFHAPYVFGVASAEIPAEVRDVVLQGAYEGSNQAASDLLQLQFLPRSLVVELLGANSVELVKVDNVDNAGRWHVPIEDTLILTRLDPARLAVYCENSTAWEFGSPAVDRANVKLTSPSEFVVGTNSEGVQVTSTGGMGYSCAYKMENGLPIADYGSTSAMATGNLWIAGWMTLPPDTKLRDIPAGFFGR